MEFFNQIKVKLKIKNLLWSVVFCLLIGVVFWLIISTGFSSNKDMQIGLRGLDWGIPIPNWLLSCLFILLELGLFVGMFSSLKAFIKNTEYNDMMVAVQSLGDANTLGNMLSVLEKSPYSKGGNLRYNDKIVFFMKGTDVTVINPKNISDIRIGVEQTKNGEIYFVCVCYGNNVLKIETNKKNVLCLVEDLKEQLNL